jgi:pimeloyl-ACP methyl ester carboxylesterase
MKLPVETKPVLWGIAGGAIAAAIVGFSWGGWVTASTAAAKRDATGRRCLSLWLLHRSASKDSSALRTSRPIWPRSRRSIHGREGDFIEKGGWATIPGSKATEPVSGVAKACALLLVPA